MSARQISLLVALPVTLAGLAAQSNTPPVQMSQAAFARVAYHQVAPGSEPEFERFMRDAWRPIFRRNDRPGGPRTGSSTACT